MEEFLQILITFGVIIFAAVSNLRKRAHDLEESSEGLPSEGIPSELEPLAPVSKPHPKKRIATEPMHPDSQELLTPEIGLKKRSGAHKPKAASTGSYLHPQGSSLKASTAPAQAIEEQTARHPLTADFDPQKAIIWAEIMKPKFEESNP